MPLALGSRIRVPHKDLGCLLFNPPSARRRLWSITFNRLAFSYSPRREVLKSAPYLTLAQSLVGSRVPARYGRQEAGAWPRWQVVLV